MFVRNMTSSSWFLRSSAFPIPIQRSSLHPREAALLVTPSLTKDGVLFPMLKTTLSVIYAASGLRGMKLIQILTTVAATATVAETAAAISSAVAAAQARIAEAEYAEGSRQHVLRAEDAAAPVLEAGARQRDADAEDRRAGDNRREELLEDA